jgi:hypothetical protein
MSIKRASRRFVPIALALAFGMVIGGVTPASAQFGSTSTLPDAGVLRLRLGAQDHFRFEPTSGSASTQAISVGSQCRVVLGSPNLVSFSATGSGNAYAGFNGNAIGVKGGGEGQGTPCGQIDAGQTLTMNLGSALGGKMIDFAEIDVEGKGNAVFKIDGYVANGSSATLVASETYETSVGGSDSGPDSGDSDNFRVRFPKSGKTTVNRLVFSIVGTQGSASLEGGSDGTLPCGAEDCPQPSLGQTLETTDSLFHLTEVDGVLDCGQTAPLQGGNGTPLNSLKREENATGDCDPIPFNLDSSVTEDGQFIVLQKDLLNQSAQFLWTVTWVAEEGEYQETETQFDFGTGFRPLQLCRADSDNDGLPQLPPTANPEDPASELDPWCVLRTSTELDIDTGQVIVKETYYGLGDPTGRR